MLSNLVGQSMHKLDVNLQPRIVSTNKLLSRQDQQIGADLHQKLSRLHLDLQPRYFQRQDSLGEHFRHQRQMDLMPLH